VAKSRAENDLSLFLSSQCMLNGVLNFTGSARIDGTFSGEINGQGTLLVGPHAVIKAEIDAKTVIISGDVVGNISASERIELKTPGKLKGNITAPLVMMDEGVLFEGHCAMAPAENMVKPVTLLAGGSK
jgi:cytoskeletal protein CcmA (bactofilin family)